MFQQKKNIYKKIQKNKNKNIYLLETLLFSLGGIKLHVKVEIYNL
jgi:hypothetical protein